jgi:ribosome-associated heat shock protein Hsp15
MAAKSASSDLNAAADRQRIDKWLWHARMVRTRSAAAALVEAGHVRVNARRIVSPAHMLRPGDAVTLALDHSVKVMHVIGFVERRGGPQSARSLYAVVIKAGASGG